MLDMVFGFNARLGRLKFFLSCVALVIVNALLATAIAVSIYHSAASGKTPLPHSVSDLGWPVFALTAFYYVGFLMLCCMRIRDIGWDPIIVVSACIAIFVIDQVVATRMPGLALTPKLHHTLVGSLLNLGLTLVLTFWPGRDHVAPSGFADPERQAAPTKPGGRSGSVPAERMAKVASQFGRRG